ncbi:MAG: cardiolipin synthase ClsB [Nitrosomonadales bacterium]|nr:cardiolipin synthase ClsB [Nitrosomonadales bacterium]
MSSKHIVDGHTLTLLRNGEEYFPRLVAAIDGATETVYLETYIYATDVVGRMVADALRRAAARGVRTRLLFDGYGGAEFPRAWMEELRAAGVDVLKFRPEISWLTLRRQRLRRLHRKLAVVDGRVAFVGGINIISDIPGGEVLAPRLDYAVEVRGDTVVRIHAAMRRLWTMVSWMSFRRQRERIGWLPAHPHNAHHKVLFLLRDNLRHRRDIELAYIRAIAGAQHEIIIANAYFLPAQRLRLALQDAAQRGVKVVLLLQGRVEYRLQHYATLALYDELMRAGMEIYEYHTSYLHAKVAVVDGQWATVGSSNIEPFSLWLAREANLVVRDAGFAGSLRTSLMHEIVQGAHFVEHATWSKRSAWMRLLTRASYAMMRLLTSVIGFARGRDDV